MDRIRRIVREMHRRSLWQVLGIYLVGSWVGYQVILGLVEGVGLPAWVPAFAVVLFIIGLPIVLATAFIQEGLPGSAPEPSRADPGPPAGRSAATEPERAPWLTWRRSLVAGVVAFLLLGMSVGGYMALRAAGLGPFGSLIAAGKLEDQARILVADFESPAGDTALASVVTEAFRIDLSRSTAARVVEPRHVRDVLLRMGVEDAPRLDPELAREIALRDGIEAYITGEVAHAPGGYVLVVRLNSTADDEVLAAVRESARGDDDLIPAIDRLSRTLRERTGESLRTIRRAEPLAEVTTPSLAALQKYTEGHRAAGWFGDARRAHQLHEEAVALDSSFAAAHFALAVSHFNAYEFEAALAAIEKSLRWRDRLTEAQQHGAQAMYHNIRREYSQAAAANERAVAVDPRNYAALNNLALAHGRMGDLERAAHHYRRAIETDTLRFFAYVNLGEALVRMGRTDAARDTFARAVQLAPASSWAIVSLALAEYPAGGYDETEKKLRAVIDDQATSGTTRDRAANRLRQLLLARGRFQETQRMRESTVLARRGPAAVEEALLEARLTFELWTLGDLERARRSLASLMRSAADDAESGRLRNLAEHCAWVGDAPCARDYLARSGFTGTLQPWTDLQIYSAVAGIAAVEGDRDAALRHIRTGIDTNCPRCEEAVAGRIFDQAGQADSALAAYERYLSTPSLDRIFVDAWLLGPTLKRVGELYEERNDRARAARAYTHLLQLWENADADLQPVVGEARRRLAMLQPDR